MSQVNSESVGSELLGNLGELLVVEGLGLGSDLLLLGLEELLALCLSLLFEGLDDGGSSPADLLSELSKEASLSVGLDSQDLEGLGHDHSLLLIIREGDTLEHLESLESGGTSGGLVGKHASQASPEHAGGSSVVLESSAGVGVDGLSQELLIVEVISEEGAGEDQLLAANHDNLLTSEELLGDLGSESSDEVASSIYDNLLFEHT
mmetsp:Transcript_7958/g.12307  ORF Transcript_7958/g.12307 Transcript_7958/m.12307 type:complete len:206 (+) Transcript_7958:139-756(+)